MDKLSCYLTFSHFEGIGPRKLTKLLEYFGDITKAFVAKPEVTNMLLGGDLGTKFDRFKRDFDVVKKAEEIENKGIRIITMEDHMYPEPLKKIYDPPICIYVKGSIQQYNFSEEKFLAIVGTRKPSPYGLTVTRKLATELVSYGFVIVSGMAIGIDTYAHQATLDAGGKTIAFLGNGVDIPHPSFNTRLYAEIIHKKGLVISEFPPGMYSQKGLFVTRNRLISGLSMGVIVVEGEETSGSLITARSAIEQGKEAFAIPGPVTSSLSDAPHKLLREGAAKIVTRVEDILEEFQVTRAHQAERVLNLNPQERSIFNELSRFPHLADELAFHFQVPVSQILSHLSSLEIQGIIERNSEGKYQLKS